MKKWTQLYRLLLTAGIALAASTAAPAADKLENIPLQFAPTSPMSERDPVDVKGLESIKLQVDAFTDAREDSALIGRDVNRQPIRKVTTREDVPRFVTYQVKNLLAGLGLDVVESSGAVVMKGEVRKFFAEEANRYSATVELRVTLADPDGKVLWAVETTGTSSRYGMGYKADNYYEVLSDALVGAVHELAGNPNFRKALAGK